MRARDSVDQIFNRTLAHNSLQLHEIHVVRKRLNWEAYFNTDNGSIEAMPDHHLAIVHVCN